MIKTAVTSVFASALIFTLAACDKLADMARAEERERRAIARDADRLERGNEVIAACILVKCARLNLDGMLLEDFAVINDMDHVEALMVSRTNFDDLDDIRDLSGLKELHITSSEVTDLSGLSYFPNLTVLHAQYFHPTVDKTHIAQLTGLTDLAVDGLGEGFDASFVQDMRQLENLVISWGYNKVADVEVLRNHPSLKKVDVGGTLPADQNALLTMPNLEEITFFQVETLDAALREELERRGQLRFVPAVMVC